MCFLIDNYFEDVRQDEKHVPALLESIVQSVGFVNGELRPISFKISQVRPEINNMRV